MRGVFQWASIVLALLVALFVVLFLILDWNWFKGYAVGKASDLLGRTVTVTGDIDVKFAWKPTVRVEGIHIDNVDWSPEPSILKLPLLALQIDVVKLLQGQLVLPKIELSEPTVWLERSAQGQWNWATLASNVGGQKSGGDERNGVNLPVLDQLRLRDGHVVYHDYASEDKVTLTVAELTATSASSVLAAARDGAREPTSYRQLTSEGRTWRIENLRASIGDSDLTGRLVLGLGDQRPALQGNLHSNHLDITALTDALSSRSVSHKANNKPARGQVIPDVRVDPASLRTVDAKVHFTGDQVVAAGLTWQDVEADLTLRDGHLVLEPRAALVGGTLRAKLDIESIPTPMQSSIHADVERVNLQNVLTSLGLPKEAFGAFNGTVHLAGTGHTLASFLTTADGDVVMTMRGGRLDQLLLQLMDLELGESIVSALTKKDESVPLRCVAIDFKVQDGKMQARTFAISTTDSKIVGDGVIDLGEARIDLELKPQAKDVSAFSANAPIHVHGPFRDLSISTNVGQALLSLATPVETPEAAPANCQALLERARNDASSSKP